MYFSSSPCVSHALPSNRPPFYYVNSLNAHLNPILQLLALLGAHHILHVSRISVNDIWRGIKIMKLIIQFLELSVFTSLLGPNTYHITLLPNMLSYFSTKFYLERLQNFFIFVTRILTIILRKILPEITLKPL